MKTGQARSRRPADPISAPKAAIGRLKPCDGYIPHAQYSEIKSAIDGDDSHVINIFGLGGIGKSSLLSSFCSETNREYHYYDLHNTPSYEEVANWILNNVFKNPGTSNSDKKFTLTESIRLNICDMSINVILIFDNLESIMGVGAECGKIKDDFAGYDTLFQLFITNTTNCTLVLSGRESVELNFNRNDEIYQIQLRGLDGNDTRRLLSKFKLTGSYERLSIKYSGNPLALKMAASTIKEDYNKDIDQFLSNPELPEDVYDLFRKHFNRLDKIETLILLWLAVVRSLCSKDEIKSKIIGSTNDNRKLAAAIRSLEKRCLIEKTCQNTSEVQYYLQGVILEFSTEYIIETFIHEIDSAELNFFHLLPLVNTDSKEYIIHTQKILLVYRISDRLVESHGESIVKSKLRALVPMIDVVRSYASGNIINLYSRLDSKLNDFDFSKKYIINADLRYIYLQNSNFTCATFEKVLMRNTYGTLIDVRYSYDDKTILGAATEFSVNIWDAEKLQFIAEISEHQDWVRSVDSNARYIASGSNDEKVIIYDYTNRIKIKDDGAKHSNRVRRVRFSPTDERIVYSSGDSGKLIGWNIETDEYCELYSPVEEMQRHSRCIWDFVFVNQGSQIVSVSDDKTVRLWNICTFSNEVQSKILYTHSDEIKSIAYDGTDIVLCGCDDGTILEIDIKTNVVKKFKHFDSIIWSIDYSQNTKQLICGYDDGHIVIWLYDSGDQEHLKYLRSLSEHNSKVWSVHFNRQGSHFVTSSDDFEFKVWNAEECLPLYTGRGYTCLLRTLAVSDNNNAVIIAGDDHIIRKYALDTGILTESYTGHNNHVRHLDWSETDDSFLSASDDGQVMCWGTACIPKSIFKGHMKRVWAVTHIENGKYASVGEENDIYIWDESHSDPIFRLEGHKNWIWDISYCKEKGVFATASEDETCIVWKYSDTTKTYEQIYEALNDHTQWLFAVSFSPSGNHMITCSADNTAIVYETATGVLLYRLKHDGWVWSAVFIDEETVATGSADSKIRIWRLSYDTSESLLLKTLTEHSSWVVSLGYSQKMHVLFSASADWSAKKWSVPSFEYIGELHIDKPYDSVVLDGVKGLTQAEIHSLIKQGAHYSNN